MSELVREVAESSRVVCDRGACYSSHQFAVCDVRDAVLKLKASKSDSKEQFMSDHVIHGGDALLVHLSFLFNCMLSHTVVPKQLLIAVLIPITKNRRKSMYDSSNYRSIALSSIIGKVFDRMVLNLHGHILSTSNLQFGFKPKHSTTECTFVLNHVMHHYSTRSTQCYILLLDASKAFDRVEYVRLFSLLRQRGLCSKLCLLLAQLYTNQSMRVRWKQSISREFQCSNGVKQGGVLSPNLFCIFFDELLRLLEDSGVGCYLGHRFVGALSYADDVALIAPTITAARMMLRVCEDFASSYKVLFNAEKSVLLRPVSPAEGELVLNGSKIQENNSAIHLGTRIGANSSKANIQKAVSDLYYATNIVMSKFGHCSCIVLSRLFESYCTSFYGSPLWCVADIDPLVTAWRKCIKRIWKLNMRTRTKYVTLLSKVDFFQMFLLRFYNFFINCSLSSNPNVHLVFRMCQFEYCTSIRNLHACVDNSKVALNDIFTQPSVVRRRLKNIYRESASQETLASFNALIELCYARDHLVDMHFDAIDIEFALEFFST